MEIQNVSTLADESQTNLIGFNFCIDQFAQLLNSSVITNVAAEIIVLEQGMFAIVELLRECRERDGSVFVIGNGGSAAIASHVVIDLVNMAKMRATSMLDPAVTTCISNDYGYEQVYAMQVQRFARKGDVVIAISSSGRSKNILNAIEAARVADAQVITLSGFAEDNLLRQCGDYNLWLDSKDYGQVEIGHAFALHYVTDRLKVYS